MRRDRAFVKGENVINWNGFMMRFEKAFASREGWKVLINVRYVFIGRFVLGLLMYFLQKKSAKGILFTIDRPHNYIRRLLDKQGVDSKGLMYIDAVHKISNEKGEIGPSTEILDNPLCPSLMTDALRRFKEECDEDIDFIIMDNLSAMLNYVQGICLEEMMVQIVARIGNKKDLVTLVLVDKEGFPDLYERCRLASTYEMDMDVDWFD